MSNLLSSFLVFLLLFDGTHCWVLLPHHYHITTRRRTTTTAALPEEHYQSALFQPRRCDKNSVVPETRSLYARPPNFSDYRSHNIISGGLVVMILLFCSPMIRSASSTTALALDEPAAALANSMNTVASSPRPQNNNYNCLVAALCRPNENAAVDDTSVPHQSKEPVLRMGSSIPTLYPTWQQASSYYDDSDNTSIIKTKKIEAVEKPLPSQSYSRMYGDPLDKYFESILEGLEK
jgi:hypothetical protein